jgi:glucokinase
MAVTNGGDQAMTTMRGGIDLGGTKIQAVIVDEENAVKGEARQPTPTEGTKSDVIRAMADTLADAARAAGVETSSLAGIGVGAPGATDLEAGTLGHASNLPGGWVDPYPLAAELSGLAGAPVALGNDVGVAVDAEFHLGAGAPYQSLLGVWWGTGVGSGLILDGERWLGRGSAGEFGHMIVRLGGAREVGAMKLRGTVEAYAGRAAMEAKARHAVEKEHRKTKLFHIMEHKGRTRLSSGVWASALEKEDELATELVDRAVKVLGAGIASVVNLLDLEAIVIGGGLGSRLGQPYADRIAGEMRPHLLVPEEAPPVHTTALGDLGGAIGAALLAKKMSHVAQVSAAAAL